MKNVNELTDDQRQALLEAALEHLRGDCEGRKYLLAGVIEYNKETSQVEAKSSKAGSIACPICDAARVHGIELE